MTGRSNTLALAAIIALVAIIVWQWRRIEGLTAESRLHRNEANQGAFAQHALATQALPDPSAEQSSHSDAPLGNEQFRELLRLRGTLGVLRGQLTQSANEAAEQRKQRQIDLGKFRFDTDKQWSEEQVLVNVARVALEELRVDLRVPDSMTNLDERQISSTPGLVESLREYSPYFRFKARCDEMQKAVDGQLLTFQKETP